MGANVVGLSGQGSDDAVLGGVYVGVSRFAVHRYNGLVGLYQDFEVGKVVRGKMFSGVLQVRVEVLR